jgi:hypothetical protein
VRVNALSFTFPSQDWRPLANENELVIDLWGFVEKRMSQASDWLNHQGHRKRSIFLCALICGKNPNL